MNPTESTSTDCLRELIEQSCPVHLLRESGCGDDVLRRWSERHRVWHGPEHLRSLLADFADEPAGDERDTLRLAALYHDAIYNPLRADNEDASAALLLRHAADRTNRIVQRAAEIIVASKWSKVPADTLTWRFWEADCKPLATDYPLASRVAYERAIFREYQWASWTTYREKRAEFLRDWAHRFPQQREGVEICLGLLEGLAELRPETNVVWIGCEAELQHLSSSAIRELESIAIGSGSRYVPDTAGIYGLVGDEH